MAKSQLMVALGILVEEAIHAKALNKPVELTGRRTALFKVDEVNLHATLGEESQSLSRVSALLPAEDLNFHRYR